MARATVKTLQARNEELQRRLEEAEEALDAIRTGKVESLIVEGPDGPRVFAFEDASRSYRVLVEAMNEGAATLSESGTILYCNARLARLLGAPLERVMGSSLTEWLPSDSRAGVLRMLDQATESGARAESELRAATGEQIPILLSLAAFPDSGARYVCLVATDLREKKQNERVLAEGILARAVLEQAADAIVVCDAKGRITQANSAAERMCGCRPVRANFDAAFPMALSSPLHKAGLAASALQGAVFQAEPAAFTRGDGTRAALLASATPLRDPDGRMMGCVVTMVDVSERRRIEEALRTSEQRLRALGDNLVTSRGTIPVGEAVPHLGAQRPR